MAMHVIREPVTLPDKLKDRTAFLLHGVLSPEECEDYIKCAEAKSFVKSVREVGGRQILDTDIRNNHRCIIDSPEEANKIWRRIQGYIPTRWRGCPVVGFAPRMLFLRYDAGQFYKPHKDLQYLQLVQNGSTPSSITVLIYLNEDFEGGKTAFLQPTEVKPKDKEKVVQPVPIAKVTPVVGSALVYQSDLLHEGTEVTRGRKYTVRLDVVYANGLPMRIRVRQK